MNLGAALGFYQDSAERRAYLQSLQDPAVGFLVTKDGTWLWRFSMRKLQGDVDAPAGCAVALASVLGVPLPRLRLALPDELLTWDLGTGMGRAYALSKSRMGLSVDADTRERAARTSVSHVPKSGAAADEEFSNLYLEAPATSMEGILEEFVGTGTPHSARARCVALRTDCRCLAAIVLAFLQVAALIPVGELAQRKSAAKAHFDGVVVRARWQTHSSVPHPAAF